MKKHYNIFDAHCDTLSLIADGTAAEKCAVTAAGIAGYDSYTQMFACFIAPCHRERAMDRFIRIADLFDGIDMGCGKLLSIEGAEMIRNVEDVDLLHSRGVRCAALTWNDTNALAGGADDPGAGLTPLGKSVIRRMEELGITVDVSHLNDRSFYDVMSVVSLPVIATHSNSRAVCCHRRNLTDEMFSLIRESGGAVGINLYPPFLTGTNEACAADAARHILHWLEIGGGDAVGIGADFDGTDGLLPRDIRGCGELYRLFDELAALGVSETEIEAITHINFEKVLV